MKGGRSFNHQTNAPFLHSIREFCELDMPIIMFDKDGNFSILKLEEVTSPIITSNPHPLHPPSSPSEMTNTPQLLPMSFGPEALGVPDPAKLAQAAKK